MKKRIAKTMLLTILAMVFGMLLSVGVQAAGKPAIVTKRVYIYKDSDYMDEYDDEYDDLCVKFKNIPKGAKIVLAESSNEKVLDGIAHDAGYDESKTGGGWQVILIGKKPGKSKLTITYKTLSGKKVKLSKTITVIKYPDPVKSVVVNGKKMKIEKGIADCGVKLLKNKKGDAKVKVQLRSGWKIVKNKSYVTHEGEVKDPKKPDEEPVSFAKKKKFKNGMTVSKQDKEDEIEVVLRLKKGTQTASYCIWFY